MTVFTLGKYEANVPAGWGEGDWNGDGEFSSGDFVTAFADGGYVAVWGRDGSGGSDSSGVSVQGQRLAPPRFALVGSGGRCLEVEDSDPPDGAAVHLVGCNGSDSQQWQMELRSASQRIRTLRGKCLVPDPPGDSGDVRVVVGECGGPGDRWEMVAPGVSKPSELLHVETGKCLDVAAEPNVGGPPSILVGCHAGSDQAWRPAPVGCTQDSRGRCLNRNRFRVDVEWRDYQGNTGTSRVAPLGSDDSGLFWFFSEDNWEMLIKVLDGCAINDRFWVFGAATTDVEYTLRVTDTAVGAIREYFNSLGTASPAITDADAFATCNAHSAAAGARLWTGPVARENLEAWLPGIDGSHRDGATSKGACVQSPVDMCLQEGRFLVEVEWRDYEENTGSGHVPPDRYSDDSGILWFFSEDNWEMLVKVLDGCVINDRFWVYAAAPTDVEYTLRVTDLETNSTQEYFNPLGTASPAITDTQAFATCP